MELLYLYLHNYRGTFLKQQFNLSGKWRFNYDESQGALTVEENHLHIDEFFKLSNINEEDGTVVNVTGIIGKNGAGKTTVLEFIKENLVNGAGGLKNKAIIIVKNGEEKLIYTHSSLKVSNGNFHKYGYNVVLYDDKQELNKSPLGETTIVFFSNIFDAKREMEWEGMRNISTNFLVINDKMKALELKRVNDNFSESTYYRREEILRQLRLIRRNQENDFSLPIHMPDNVVVMPNPTALQIEDYRGTDKKKTPEMEKARFLHENVYKWLVQMKLNAQGIDSIKISFFIAAVNTFLNELVNFYKYVLSDSLLTLRNTYDKDIDQNLNPYLRIRAFIKKIIDTFKKENEPEHIIKRVNNLLHFLQVLDESITQNNVSNGTHFYLPTSQQENGNDILSFLAAYTDAIGFLSFLEFEWRDLSSGEKALLGTYARFYSLCDDVETATNMRLANNVLVLIDEGELFLHPDWQKSYLADLLTFLPKIYKNKNIQIIMTSNSPFIASDLLNSNLIFIDKSSLGCKVIDGLSEDKNTFAANIHTLLSDAFFMKRGLIGDFASHKVNMLIQKIKNNLPEELIRGRQSIEALISQIGEPVLRSKLYSMYREKTSPYLSNNAELLNLVMNLQDELNELKRERGK